MSPCYNVMLVPSPNLTYNTEYTFSYRSKKSIRASSYASTHAHRTKFRGGNFKHFTNSVGHPRKLPPMVVERKGFFSPNAYNHMLHYFWCEWEFTIPFGATKLHNNWIPSLIRRNLGEYIDEKIASLK